MIPLNGIAYCELDLDYPTDVFCAEIDQYLIPDGQLIKSVTDDSLHYHSETNKSWDMMSDEDYNRVGNNLSWYANSLLYCDTDNKEFRDLSRLGSIVVRNNYLGDAEWKWKPEYQHLELTKYIQSLPLTDIIHARTLCMPPGRMSSIHRDGKRSNLSKTLLSDNGYISITLNVSDGNQPLYFALTSDEKTSIKTTAKAFIFNDYNLHGVPRVSSWRRQVRVTGKPTEEFSALMKMETLLLDK